MCVFGCVWETVSESERDKNMEENKAVEIQAIFCLSHKQLHSSTQSALILEKCSAHMPFFTN